MSKSQSLTRTCLAITLSFGLIACNLSSELLAPVSETASPTTSNPLELPENLTQSPPDLSEAENLSAENPLPEFENLEDTMAAQPLSAGPASSQGTTAIQFEHLSIPLPTDFQNQSKTPAYAHILNPDYRYNLIYSPSVSAPNLNKTTYLQQLVALFEESGGVKISEKDYSGTQNNGVAYTGRMTWWKVRDYYKYNATFLMQIDKNRVQAYIMSGWYVTGFNEFYAAFINGLLNLKIISSVSNTPLSTPTPEPKPIIPNLPEHLRAENVIPLVPNQEQLEVLGVLFVPSDVSFPAAEEKRAIDLFTQELQSAQAQYKRLLETDTFKISAQGVRVYRAKLGQAAYNDTPENQGLDRRMPELLAWQGEDRYNSKHIFVQAYVRPLDQPLQGNRFGGAVTFNGAPNTGGGKVELEYGSLVNGQYYTFQSTLIHEIGHAFGLNHVDCNGYDMQNNNSLMSYSFDVQNPGLNPEEYYSLALSKRAFPNFQFDPAKHNPQNKSLEKACLGYPKSDTQIGEWRRFSNVGYELFHNGQLVSGIGAEFMRFSEAKSNCDWNIQNNSHLQVECRYNGKTFYP